MKVLTRALIKKSEENAVNNGIFSYKELMFRAGSEAARIIMEKIDCRNKKITVVCGKGNNGGDGFVIAEILAGNGANVTVLTPLGPPQTESASFYFNKIKIAKKIDEFNISGADIIIDALFGIGLDRPLTGKAADITDKINSTMAHKISVDIPSGVETDSGSVSGTAVFADLTITFIALKPCFLLPEGSDRCGEFIIADIGVDSCGFDYLTIGKPVFEKRRHNSHKGTFGTALLYCGSYGMAGAAILSARAALRTGAGIVKCVLCDGIYTAFTCAVPEAVCVPVKQTENGTLPYDVPLISGGNAILIGCGLGNNSDTAELVKKIILETNIPVVIDADGINALCGSIDIIKKCKAPVILTPHPGEMARLLKTDAAKIESDRIGTARTFAKLNNCILVLKGANTIVAFPDESVFFNTTGNPGMSTGGSGDVLSGMIVSLLAQGLSPEKAVTAAVYLHGEAGDKVAQKRSERAILPSDMIEEL